MKVKYKEKYHLNVPSWDSIIHNLQHSIDNNLPMKSNNNSFYVTHHAHLILETKPLMKKLKAYDAHLYINFFPETKTFGKHKDTMDVAFWQVQGETEWTVEDKVYILNPGDLIYVPKGIEHSVHPLTIRAGISFGV